MGYYKTLNVDREATPEQIKKAYLRLAKEWHPDKHIDNKELAEEKFKEIGEAYSVLSDIDKRKVYDLGGQTALQINDTDSFDEIDHNELFQQIFAGLSEIESVDCQYSNYSDIKTNIELNLKQMYLGCVVQHSIERMVECKKCACKKNKKNKNTQEKYNKCNKCNGDKIVSEKINLEITLNPGIYNGYRMVIENEGNFIPIHMRNNDDANTRTNVICIITEQASKNTQFIRNPRGFGLQDNVNNLLLEKEISVADALCGLNLNYPIRHNDIYVLKKEGMPLFNTNIENTKKEFGDLIIHFTTQHPKDLSLSRNSLCKIYKDITGTQYVPPTNSITKLMPLHEYISQQKRQNISDDDDMQPTTCHTQ